MIPLLNSKPLPGTPINKLHPLARGLVGYWLLNDGGTLAWDSSGNNNHGILTNMHPPTDYVGGKFGTALDFDGIDDYVDCGNITAVHHANVTFLFWVKVNNTSEDHDFITKGFHGFNEPLIIWFDSDVGPADVGGGNVNTLSVLTDDGVTQHWVAGTNNALNNTNWNHIGVRIDIANNSISLYINGQLNQSNTKAWNGINANSDSIRLGDSTPSSSPLNGLIDNISIYDRALLAQEIQQLYIMSFSMFERPSVARYFVPTDGAEVYSGRGIGRGILRGVIR